MTEYHCNAEYNQARFVATLYLHARKLGGKLELKYTLIQYKEESREDHACIFLAVTC